MLVLQDLTTMKPDHLIKEVDSSLGKWVKIITLPEHLSLHPNNNKIKMEREKEAIILALEQNNNDLQASNDNKNLPLLLSLLLPLVLHHLLPETNNLNHPLSLNNNTFYPPHPFMFPLVLSLLLSHLYPLCLFLL